MALPKSLTIQSWFGPIRINPADPDLFQNRPLRKVRGQCRYYRGLGRGAEGFAVELLGSRRKLRGQRRYYRGLGRDAEAFTEALSGWYDFHHRHVDRHGLGNLRWRARRAHLAALFTMLRRLLTQTAGWELSHQCWLQIDAFDSSQDAIFVHTPNHNAENFPYTFEGTVWDVEIPQRLSEFITDPSWQFGRIE